MQQTEELQYFLRNGVVSMRYNAELPNGIQPNLLQVGGAPHVGVPPLGGVGAPGPAGPNGGNAINPGRPGLAGAGVAPMRGAAAAGPAGRNFGNAMNPGRPGLAGAGVAPMRGAAAAGPAGGRNVGNAGLGRVAPLVGAAAVVVQPIQIAEPRLLSLRDFGMDGARLDVGRGLYMATERWRLRLASRDSTQMLRDILEIHLAAAGAQRYSLTGRSRGTLRLPQELINILKAALRKFLATLHLEQFDQFLDVLQFQRACPSAWTEYQTWLGVNANGARINNQQPPFEKAVALALIKIQKE